VKIRDSDEENDEKAGKWGSEFRCGDKEDSG